MMSLSRDRGILRLAVLATAIHAQHTHSLSREVNEIERTRSSAAVAMIDANAGKSAIALWSQIPSGKPSAFESVEANRICLNTPNRETVGNQLRIQRLFQRGRQSGIPKRFKIGLTIERRFVLPHLLERHVN